MDSVGKHYGFEDDREATIYHLTPEERAQRHGQRQAVSMLAFELDGLFDEELDEAEGG